MVYSTTAPKLRAPSDVGWCRPYENTTFSVAKQQARHSTLAMCRRDWHLSFHGWWFAAAQALETSKGCHGSCRWCAGAEPWYFFRRRWCGHLLDWFERIDLFMDGEYANKKRVGMTTIQTRRYTSWFPLAPHHIPGYFLSSSCVFNGNAVKSIQIHILWYKHTHKIYSYTVYIYI